MVKQKQKDSCIVSILKSCDIYQKMPKDLVEPSTSGATLTIIVIIV